MKKILLVLSLLGTSISYCQSLNVDKKTRGLYESARPIVLTLGSATLASAGYILFQDPALHFQVTATVLMLLSVLLAAQIPKDRRFFIECLTNNTGNNPFLTYTYPLCTQCPQQPRSFMIRCICPYIFRLIKQLSKKPFHYQKTYRSIIVFFASS